MGVQAVIGVGFMHMQHDFQTTRTFKELKQWSINYKDLNNYQRKIISNFDNILKRNAGTSSWTVVGPDVILQGKE